MSNDELPAAGGPAVDEAETERTRRRYDRGARLYDAMQAFPERRNRRLRRRLWASARGPMLLEVGVGTGANLEYHPQGVNVTAIDLSPRMLERARGRAASMGREIELRLGDVQALEFPDATFDQVVASYVFCSVPDPVQGLREVLRVLKPGGSLLLLEHVRATGRVSGAAMDLLNPVFVRLTGANINRRTVANVESAGFTVEHVEGVGMGGLVKLIEAHGPPERPPEPSHHPSDGRTAGP